MRDQHEPFTQIWRIMGFVACFGAFLSCGEPFAGENASSQTKSRSDRRVIAQDDELKRIKKLVSEDGFRIPCLEGARIKKDSTSLGQQTANEEVFVVIYEPVRCPDDDGGVFHKLVGGVDYEWKVVSIASYQTKNTVFEHTVKFNIVGTGSILELTYLDTGDDGKFDTVFQSPDLKKPILPPRLRRP